MRRRIIEAGVRRMERDLGVELDYVREMVRVSPGAAERLALLRPLGTYGRAVPETALHLARLGATRVEDCGACVQIALNLAARAGVPPGALRAALGGEGEEALDDALRLALAFGEASALRDGPALDRLRGEVRGLWGDAGVVELSLAAAGAQFYPVLKRAMGFATSCSAYGPTVPEPV